MQVNQVGTNNQSYQGSSAKDNTLYLMRHVAIDAMIGAAANAALSYGLSKVSQVDFLQKGNELIEANKNDKVKAGLKGKLSHLFELREQKKLEEVYKNNKPVVDAVKEIFRKVKTEQALRSAKIGALICGGMGLVVGLVNVYYRNKSN